MDLAMGSLVPLPYWLTAVGGLAVALGIYYLRPRRKIVPRCDSTVSNGQGISSPSGVTNKSDHNAARLPTPASQESSHMTSGEGSRDVTQQTTSLGQGNLEMKESLTLSTNYQDSSLNNSSLANKFVQIKTTNSEPENLASPVPELTLHVAVRRPDIRPLSANVSGSSDPDDPTDLDTDIRDLEYQLVELKEQISNLEAELDQERVGRMKAQERRVLLEKELDAHISARKATDDRCSNLILRLKETKRTLKQSQRRCGHLEKLVSRLSPSTDLPRINDSSLGDSLLSHAGQWPTSPQRDSEVDSDSLEDSDPETHEEEEELFGMESDSCDPDFELSKDIMEVIINNVQGDLSCILGADEDEDSLSDLLPDNLAVMEADEIPEDITFSQEISDESIGNTKRTKQFWEHIIALDQPSNGTGASGIAKVSSRTTGRDINPDVIGAQHDDLQENWERSYTPDSLHGSDDAIGTDGSEASVGRSCDIYVGKSRKHGSAFASIRDHWDRVHKGRLTESCDSGGHDHPACLGPKIETMKQRWERTLEESPSPRSNSTHSDSLERSTDFSELKQHWDSFNAENDCETASNASGLTGENNNNAKPTLHSTNFGEIKSQWERKASEPDSNAESGGATVSREVLIDSHKS